MFDIPAMKGVVFSLVLSGFVLAVLWIAVFYMMTPAVKNWLNFFRRLKK
jgi:small-conductance mechanosensitive channel